MDRIVRDGSVRRAIPMGWILRVGGSITLLGLIMYFLPFRDIWSIMKSVSPGIWIGVLAAFMVGHTVAAFKWWALAIRGTNVGFRQAMRAHFSGLAANLCLPGAAGGDVVRAALVMSGADNKTKIAIGSLVDRLIDTFALLVLAGSGAFLTRDHQGTILGPFLGIVLAVFALVGLAIAVVVLLGRFSNSRFAGLAQEAVQQYRRRPLALLQCLLLSLFVQSLLIVLNMIFGRIAGVDVEAGVWFFAWPIAKLIAMLPISIAGLGVRETSLAALMSPYGSDPVAVIGSGFVWQTILFASGLIGGLALLVSNRFRPFLSEPRSTPPAERSSLSGN